MGASMWTFKIPLVFSALVFTALFFASASHPAFAAGIPEDAQWTVCCTQFIGPGHIEQSTAMRDRLVQQTKLRDWRVEHTADHSTIYYGFYRAIDDKKDAK